jgi:predicted phage tail protein
MRFLLGLGSAVILGGVAFGLNPNPAAASSQNVDSASGKRPMTFADLQRIKRIGDPQISASGKWVMFSATDVDLEKNTKVSHRWVEPRSR